MARCSVAGRVAGLGAGEAADRPRITMHTHDIWAPLLRQLGDSPRSSAAAPSAAAAAAAAPRPRHPPRSGPGIGRRPVSVGWCRQSALARLLVFSRHDTTTARWPLTHDRLDSTRSQWPAAAAAAPSPARPTPRRATAAADVRGRGAAHFHASDPADTVASQSQSPRVRRLYVKS